MVSFGPGRAGRGSVGAALGRAPVVGGPEARAAAARRDGVRVVDREAGAHQGVDVVDLRALEQVDALAVDVDLDPAGVEDAGPRASGRPRASSRSGSRSSRRNRRRRAGRCPDWSLPWSARWSLLTAASVSETTVVVRRLRVDRRRLLVDHRACRPPGGLSRSVGWAVERPVPAHRTHGNGFRQAPAPKLSYHRTSPGHVEEPEVLRAEGPKPVDVPMDHAENLRLAERLGALIRSSSGRRSACRRP